MLGSRSKIALEIVVFPAPDGDDAGGVRTDTQIISELLVNSVERGYVYDEQAFSHHAPVVIDYDVGL